jgi:phytoene dehydrogenase-like protein
MAQPSIVIVGGGIAGLAAGCYAQMNGYRATVLEMHSIPGGLCTAWSRKGYTFDISMHMLVGYESGPFHRMWRELGVVQGRQFVTHDPLLRIETMGKKIDVSPDLDRFERELLALAPGDAELIREFIGMARRLVHVGVELEKPRELWGPREVLAAVAASIAANEIAGEQLGRDLEPAFLEAARAEGFAILPPQEPGQK